MLAVVSWPASIRVSTSWRKRSLEKAAPAKTAKPTKAAKPGCDPPYTVDGQGEKVFKPECF